jgi:type IV fimbrial biogenesis protein FimT
MLGHKTWRYDVPLKTHTKSGLSGFSLVEMMIGLVIVGVLVGIAMPPFRALLINTEIRNAAESIQNGLQRARAEAITRGTTLGVTFALSPPVPGDATSWIVSVNDLPVKVIDSRLSSEGSRDVTRFTFPAAAALVTFDSTGRPMANPDGSATLSSISLNVPPSVLSPAEAQNLDVKINFDGQIRMCDPNVFSPNPRAC